MMSSHILNHSRSNVKITRKNPYHDNIKVVEIAIQLKYFSNFCRAFETSLINCETNFILTWSSTCVITTEQVQKHLQ